MRFARVYRRGQMKPDVFITAVFAAFVVVFTSSAVAVIVHMVRRQRRAMEEAQAAEKRQPWTSA